MPIDISQDLIITTDIISVETKTIDSLYAEGNPPGTYLPGKDFSESDNVSTGNITSYAVGISLTSKTGQSYSIDKLFLQSVDDQKTNGTGAIPFYWINTDINPQNITDDNNYTIVPNYNANMTSVVFDQNAGVTSTSTAKITMNVNYPNGLYWKSKIAPKIQVVAVKSGIQKISSIVKLEEVKMSSFKNIQTDFYRSSIEWDGIRLANNTLGKGFNVPFYMETTQITPSNNNTLLDTPKATSIVYSANLNYTIDGSTIPVSESNVSIDLQSGSGISIQEFSVTDNQLNITLNRTGDIVFPLLLRIGVFLPYDPGDKDSVTMIMTGVWNSNNDGGVKFNNWENSYIFSESEIDGINSSQVIPLKFAVNPILIDSVDSSYNVSSTEIISYFLEQVNFCSIQASKMLLLFDSEIASISDSPPYLQVSYVKIGESMWSNYAPPLTDYIQQYGYVDLQSGYNATDISYNVFNKKVFLGSYQDIVNTGNKPNILMTTILTDILSGLNMDYDKGIIINYENAYVVPITNAQFKAAYEANPTQDFTGRLYTAMRIGTNIDSVENANTQYASLLAAQDEFVNVDNKVFLDLSTRNWPDDLVVDRFNSNSWVRSDLKIMKYNVNFKTSITDDNINTITSISDYSRVYSLRMFIKEAPPVSNGDGIFLKDAVITFAIPDKILPYIYIFDSPRFYKLDSNIPILIATVTNYSLSSKGIKIVVPSDILFENDIVFNKQTYLDIPIKFLLPGQDTVFSHEITSYDKKQLLLNNPGELTDRFSAATPYYKDAQHYESSTLQSADLDFIGLATNKNYYQNGTSVNFIANVKNELDKPNTIYMSMTVPSNLYNPIETSNNSQEAFIQNIVAFYTTTVIYYQTASKATPQDIQAMKDLNVPGKSLDDYYNTVVINNWTLYNVADSLPSDVVMLVARTENIPQGTIVRIDYEVNVKMDINTTNSYINNGAIQYYSSTAQLESRSNTVKIQNYNLNNEILITKSPDHQKVNVTTGTEGIFDIKFTVPMEAESYTNLLFEDQLPKALTLSPSSTIQIGTNAEQPLNASISSTKLVTLLFTNMSQIVGQDIKIKMVTIVDEPINIPLDNIDTNKASLLINSDPTLISLSNSVNVEFSFDDLFNLDKSPELQNYQKISGEKVEFQIYFDVPQDATEITSMVIKDILHPALSYDPLNSILQIGTSLVEALNAIVTNNTVEINLSNIQQAAGQAVRITLGAILSDINALPTDGVVENYAMLTLNNVPAYSFKSNTVTATFGLEINPVQITKAPNVQQVNEEVGEKVTFQLSFAIPENVLGYKEITIIDIIDESLKYDVMNSTIQFDTLPVEVLNASLNGNTVTKILTDLNRYEGKAVLMTIVAAVSDLSKIPSDMKIKNSAQIVVNDDLNLLSKSNEVVVQFKQVSEKSPLKISDTEELNIAQDKEINFEVTYFTGIVGSETTTIIVEDKVDSNFKIINYALNGIVSTPNITITDDTVGNTIKFTINTNYPAGSLLLFPTFFKLEVETKYVADTIKDITYAIENKAIIKIGDNEPLTSNIIKIYPIGPREQSITDIIESIALEETALSHIINAEGEKIQKILVIEGVSNEVILKTNKSVREMIASIKSLEVILQSKLQLFGECLCKKNKK